MDKMRSRIVWTIVAFAGLLIMISLMRFNLTAIPEPGHVETRTANLAKRVLIYHASRQTIPPRPLDTKASADNGGTHYGLECSICHGIDGHTQAPLGRWMYPRPADLTSKQVQSYSDQELFWIIQNGIRFTGMPAFGEVESPDHIWNLVNYVRTLPGELHTENSTANSAAFQVVRASVVDSNSDWPSFTKPIEPENVKTHAADLVSDIRQHKR
jgi:mono/diheme cytochrome c family protein